jgi:hypothetical protein
LELDPRPVATSANPRRLLVHFVERLLAACPSLSATTTGTTLRLPAYGRLGGVGAFSSKEGAFARRPGYVAPVRSQERSRVQKNARRKSRSDMNMQNRAATVLALALASISTACGGSQPPAEEPGAAVAEERAEKAEEATDANTDRAENAADKAEDSAAASDKSADKAEKSAEDSKK